MLFTGSVLPTTRLTLLILLPSCLKVLKPPALPNHSLKHFYTTVIRPILEYCSVVWGHNLSKKQSSQLESIQKTAIRILYQETRHMLYLITVTLHPYKTDAPNKQKVSSHQFWTNLHAYIISSRSKVTMLLLLGCVCHSNFLCCSPGQRNFNRL